MSFFADMLAGGLAGGAQGYELQLKQEQEERRYKDQQAEKAALALTLQQQRSEDLRYRVDQDAANKADRLAMMGERGSGTGRGGAGGSFMNALVFGAKTPEEQDMAIRYTETRKGSNAARLLADKYYGRPVQETVEQFDPEVAALRDRKDYAEENPDAVETKKVTRNANYDRDEGQQSLNRLMAMADPSKFDQYMKAERGEKLNDNATKVEKGTLGRDKAEITQSLTNPTADPNKVDASIQNAETRADTQIAVKKLGASGSKTAQGAKISPELNGVRRSIADMAKVASNSGSKAVAALSSNSRYNALLAQETELVEASRVGRGGPAPAKAMPADRAGQFKVIR